MVGCVTHFQYQNLWNDLYHLQNFGKHENSTSVKLWNMDLAFFSFVRSTDLMPVKYQPST